MKDCCGLNERVLTLHMRFASGQWGLLILLLKKSLMRHRPADQDPDLRFQLDSSKELQLPLNKRFSLNLPDCSAVLESQANYNLMDTHEISWLDKFAEDNQKMCNSRLFDEAGGMGMALTAPSQTKNQMKFSFNMNYQHEQGRREERPHQQQTTSTDNILPQREPSPLTKDHSSRKLSTPNQNILSDIQNTQETTKRGRKDSQVGSIKKNAKHKAAAIAQISAYDQEAVESLPIDMLDDMDRRLSKALSNHRSAYIDLISNKQNENLSSEKSMGNLLSQTTNMTSNMSANTASSNNKPTTTFDSILKEHRRARDVPSVPAIQTKPIPISTMTAPSIQQDTPPSQNASSALEILFTLLDKTQTGKLSKFNCAAEALPEDFKFILGSILTNIRFRQYSYNKREFLQSCEKITRQLDSTEVLELMKDLEGKEKNKGKVQNYCDRSELPFKASFFEDKSMQKDKKKQGVQSQCQWLKETKSYNQILQNSCKGSNLSSKYDDITFESSRNHQKSSQSTRKYSEIPKASSSKQVTMDEHFTFYPKQRPQHSQGLFKEDSSRRRSNVNVTESMLQEHQKSIQSLKKLNERMESCLSMNVLSEHSKSGLSRKDSLSFDELIKHV